MNYTDLIKNDTVLSAYDYGTVYQVIMRLKDLGVISETKIKRCKDV